MKALLKNVALCCVLALVCGGAAVAQEDAQPKSVVSRWFEAVTDVQEGAEAERYVCPDGLLAIPVPQGWVEVGVEDALYAFEGVDDFGNRARVNVVKLTDSDMTGDMLEERVRSGQIACKIIRGGMTFYVFMAEGDIISAWLSDDGVIYALDGMALTTGALGSEKLIRDLGLMLCGVRAPGSEAEAEPSPDGAAVQFRDAEFERMVRKALGKPPEEDIRPDELTAIEKIYMCCGEISFEGEIENPPQDYTQPDPLDLVDLALFPGLETLDIMNMRCFGFDVLRQMPGLRNLTLSRTGLRDCAPLEELPLVRLTIAGNSIVDFSPIATLHKLRSLNLYETGLDSLEIVRGMNLNLLIVGDNPVADLDPIADMKNLVYLGLQGTQVESLEALRNLTSLSTLDISDLNRAISLEPLYELPCLTSIYAWGTTINPVDEEWLGEAIW